MKLSDEQLANPDNHGSIARAHVWCGNHYEYPLIADMARELLAARKLAKAVQKCYDEGDRGDNYGRMWDALLALAALDKATKQQRQRRRK